MSVIVETILFGTLILGLLTIVILYFTGLGFLSRALFNLEDCGCVQTKVLQGEKPVIISSGSEYVSSKGKPLITSITPVRLDNKIDLNSAEHGISKMSLVLTWMISLVVLVAMIIINHKHITKFYGIVTIIIGIFALIYYIGLGYLTNAIFDVGDCGCDIVSKIELGTGSGSLAENPNISIESTPAKILTRKKSNIRLKDFNIHKLNISKMVIIFIWIMWIVIIPYLIWKIKNK